MSERMEKISRLLQRVEKMALVMEAHGDLRIHQHVSQFYYMQKAAELRIWHAQLEELHQRIVSLSVLADDEYQQIYCRWRKDVRWLSRLIDDEVIHRVYRDNDVSSSSEGSGQ